MRTLFEAMLNEIEHAVNEVSNSSCGDGNDEPGCVFPECGCSKEASSNDPPEESWDGDDLVWTVERAEREYRYIRNTLLGLLRQENSWTEVLDIVVAIDRTGKHFNDIMSEAGRFLRENISRDENVPTDGARSVQDS